MSCWKELCLSTVSAVGDAMFPILPTHTCKVLSEHAAPSQDLVVYLPAYLQSFPCKLNVLLGATAEQGFVTLQLVSSIAFMGSL